MSEQPAQSIYERPPEVDFTDYKAAVRKRDGLVSRSFMGGIRRTIAQYTRGVGGYANYYNDALHGPRKAQATSQAYLAANLEALENQAIIEAIAAGVKLNLPENSLPEVATDVVLLPSQEA